MPPKGWRKNSEGQSLSVKGKEEVSIDDLLFPRTTIQQLAKSILNEDEDQSKASNMMLAKDSLIAVQRSATVFVSYMLFHARQGAKDANRKTVNAQDILGALERSELNGFIPEVKSKLSVYEDVLSARKQSKADRQVKTDSGDSTLDEDNVQSKRLKDNQLNSIKKSVQEDLEYDDTEETEDKTAEDDEIEENVENDLATDGEVEEDDDNEDVNPIAALDEEEKEVRGTEAEDEKQVSSDDES